MRLWPLCPHIKNVALVHSCLEIPIPKCLRCRRSSQMNKHMFENSHQLNGIAFKAREEPSSLWSTRAGMANRGHRHLWLWLTEVPLEHRHNLHHLCRLCEPPCVNKDISHILISSHEAFQFSRRLLFSAAYSAQCIGLLCLVSFYCRDTAQSVLSIKIKYWRCYTGL